MIAKLNPGARFGRLTYVSVAKHLAGRHRVGVFRCDCGTITEKPLSRVTHGRVKSCGCYMREMRVTCGIKHGGKGTREYRQWSGAKNRCFNSRSKDFARYGGRGISMCLRWATSFPAFVNDMGKCPQGFTLDRVDVNGDYEPSNCRWATVKQQANNRRNTVRTVAGTVGDLAGQLGISHGAAYMRHKRGRLHV